MHGTFCLAKGKRRDLSQKSLSNHEISIANITMDIKNRRRNDSCISFGAKTT
jgi:hypothetical protein